MKILLLGDVHEAIDKAKKIIDSVECDFVLQTGDLGTYSDFSKPSYFIAGNHENWNILKDMDTGKTKFTNLCHIKNAEIIKLVKDKEIMNVSGINGNYSEKRYELRIKERERHFNKQEVDKCKKLRNIDIFLSHEAPASIGFMKKGKDIGVKPVKEILDIIKPKFFIFGHHHIFFEKLVNLTKILGLNYARNEYYILDTNKNEIKRIIV